MREEKIYWNILTKVMVSPNENASHCMTSMVCAIWNCCNFYLSHLWTNTSRFSKVRMHWFFSSQIAVRESKAIYHCNTSSWTVLASIVWSTCGFLSQATIFYQMNWFSLKYVQIKKKIDECPFKMNINHRKCKKHQLISVDDAMWSSASSSKCSANDDIWLQISLHFQYEFYMKHDENSIAHSF